MLAPTDDWEAALAASVLMASPVRAPLLLSGSGSLPAATAARSSALAPSGSSSLAGAQVIRIGDTPAPSGLRAAPIKGADPFTLTAAIDEYATAAAGKPSTDVVIASADAPAYAMPAAGWAAESGDPILFVVRIADPSRDRPGAHERPAHPNIYVLGPTSVVSDALVKQLGKYGKVSRVSGYGSRLDVGRLRQLSQPAVRVKPALRARAGLVRVGADLARARVRAHQRPAHARRRRGRRSVLERQLRPPAADRQPSTLPTSVLNYFLNYATPGYTQEGPTAAVYNHGWMIGDTSAVSVTVQAQVDSLLEAVPQR